MIISGDPPTTLLWIPSQALVCRMSLSLCIHNSPLFVNKFWSWLLKIFHPFLFKPSNRSVADCNIRLTCRDQLLLELICPPLNCHRLLIFALYLSPLFDLLLLPHWAYLLHTLLSKNRIKLMNKPTIAICPLCFNDCLPLLLNCSRLFELLLQHLQTMLLFLSNGHLCCNKNVVWC